MCNKRLENWINNKLLTYFSLEDWDIESILYIIPRNYEENSYIRRRSK